MFKALAAMAKVFNIVDRGGKHLRNSLNGTWAVVVGPKSPGVGAP